MISSSRMVRSFTKCFNLIWTMVARTAPRFKTSTADGSKNRSGTRKTLVPRSRYHEPSLSGASTPEHDPPTIPIVGFYSDILKNVFVMFYLPLLSSGVYSQNVYSPSLLRQFFILIRIKLTGSLKFS